MSDEPPATPPPHHPPPPQQPPPPPYHPPPPPGYGYPPPGPQHPGYPPAGYGHPPQWGYATPSPPGNPQAIVALCLGAGGLAILLFSLGAFFFLNIPMSILAWIFGVQGRRRVDRGETDQHRGLAQAGLITGIVGVVLGVLAIVAWVLLIVFAATLEETDDAISLAAAL